MISESTASPSRRMPCLRGGATRSLLHLTRCLPTNLRGKLVKIGAKIVSHGRYVIFQMAEVAVPKELFHEILRLIAELRPQPPPAPA